MVSTSRKKNKGRDRKAKKEADRVKAERVNARKKWCRWAKGEDKASTGTIACKHGCTVLLPAIIHLMDTIFSGCAKRMTDVIDLHPEVWNDDTYKMNATNILARVGTNMLLSEDANVTGIITLARLIVSLEQYDGSNSLHTAPVDSREGQRKMRDLNSDTSSIRRDALKFFSKRLPCSCLKSMHREARRTQPKVGVCYGCYEEMKRVDLSVCSRCMIAQYCSRECQVTDWTKHEWICGRYVAVAQNKNQVDESVETETG